MEITVTVCDVDQRVGVPTARYTITSEGRTVTKDLCEEHAAPLEALLAGALTAAESDAGQEQGPVRPAPARQAIPAAGAPQAIPAGTPPKKQTAARRGAPRRRPKITTLDEIEQLKKS